MKRRVILVTALLLGSVACAVHHLPLPDSGASLEVSVLLAGNSAGNRTFVARNIHVAPRPPLPSAWLSYSSGGSGGSAGMVAMAASQPIVRS
jgi:hypothetical protein